MGNKHSGSRLDSGIRQDDDRLERVSNSHTERRYNPLIDDWVLVSCERNDRPWTGQIEGRGAGSEDVSYDSTCALCPGNARATGENNPAYVGVYVFDNDFPALSGPVDDTLDGSFRGGSDLFVTQKETGRCRVVCFSDHHSMTLARMSTTDIVPVIKCFVEQTGELLCEPGVNHVQIFENRGEIMGCSNPHPHGQIWAQGHAPTLPAREMRAMADYRTGHKATLLSDYYAEEVIRAERLVCENESFAVVVPFWAAWPFETLVIPKRAVAMLTDLRDDEVEAFADIVRRITVRYDNLFQTSFPYSSGIHQCPADSEHPDVFHLHMHFFPPLLRSASIRKFMVGYEMLAEAQRDLSPEAAAEQLRQQSEIHYLQYSDSHRDRPSVVASTMPKRGVAGT